jgi:hypothetical protein
MPWLLKLPVGFLALALASDALAQTPVQLTVSGNEAKGSFYLEGGVGADLSISFEQVVGLNPRALEVSARLVSPVDPAILSRLPANVRIPEAFPVMIRIEPRTKSRLTFAGIVSISLHTHNLALVANSPLALYSGPVDGLLHDITRSVGIGSYRAGGSGGGFSEFMIVADSRPLDTVISEKFEVLEAGLNDDLGQADEGDLVGALNELLVRLGRARTSYASGAATAAVSEVTGFLDLANFYSGDVISNVWRAHDDRRNVAGLRRAAAETLRFSLHKAALPGPAPSPSPTPPPPPPPDPPSPPPPDPPSPPPPDPPSPPPPDPPSPPPPL